MSTPISPRVDFSGLWSRLFSRHRKIKRWERKEMVEPV